MSFELFTDTRSRTKEYISITENKTFGLPRTFLEKQSITSKHKAVIFYDAVNNKIALHFSLSEPKFGLAVRIPNHKQGGIVVAKSFFDLKNIDTKIYGGRYDDFEIKTLKDLGFDKDGNAYVITLKPRESKNENINVFHEDFVSEEDGDQPINLDDIPF